MTDPDRGLSSMLEEIKIKIKILGRVMSEEKKIKKGNCQINLLFSVKIAFLREKRTGKWN